jgi:hypothetical protein
MGLRLRLKASVVISGYSATNQVILTALKKYGIILADNGSNWYISGAPDPGWDDNVLATLSQVKGSSFEAVDESSLQVSADSGQAATSPAAVNSVLGTPQGALINSLFPRVLQAKVTDFLGNPVSGVTVTFTAPTTGSSGLFNSLQPASTATTDAFGIATSPPFLANGTVGSFTITATVSGITTPASFSLQNLASCTSPINPPFVVNQGNDDGTGTVCGSLSRALLETGPNTTTITFGSLTNLSVASALPPVPPGVTLDGGNCTAPGPSLTLTWIGSAVGTIGLTVQPGGSIKNIRVKGFSGKQILFLGGGTTHLSESCVVASKS